MSCRRFPASRSTRRDSPTCARGTASLGLRVFGSVARGTATPDSDIDVLYELEPGHRLGWEIEQLADELTAILGRPVDLVSPAALHRRLKDAVLSEARTLYAA
jgi:predicted nucleotidyltransferase